MLPQLMKKRIDKLLNDLKPYIESAETINDDLRYSLAKIWEYAHKMSINDISVLELATKANKDMDVINWLSEQHKDFFNNPDFDITHIDVNQLINMLKSFDMKKEKESESKEEVVDYQDKYTRLYAEFDNYKKRTIKEKQDIRTQTKFQVLSSFLGIIDDLELAKSSLGRSKDTLANKGLDIIVNKIEKYLEEQNIVEVDTSGKFDVDTHECLTVINMGKDKSGMIIETTHKGYMIDGKIVRYPKVVVGE